MTEQSVSREFQLPAIIGSRTDTSLEVLIVDGQPWFFGLDIGRMIGLANPGTSIGNLPDQYRRLHPANRGNGTRNHTIISEPGLYHLVARSDVPGARAFQDWVFGEVLPSIRATGGYQIPDYPRALRAYAQALEERDAFEQRALEAAAAAQASEQRAEVAEQRVADITPAAGLWEHVAAARGSWTMGYAVRILRRDPALTKVTASEFRASLFRVGITNWSEGAASFTSNPAAIVVGNAVEQGTTLRITPKGLAMVHRDLNGSQPLVLRAEDVAEATPTPLEPPRGGRGRVLEGELVAR